MLITVLQGPNHVEQRELGEILKAIKEGKLMIG